MNTWDERMASRPPASTPHLELLRTVFRVVGASGRPMRCALYRTDAGHELRLEYEDREDLLRSQLFRVDDEDAIAGLAGEWRAALLMKGFTDLVVQ